jgi:uncharacterized protein
MNITVTAHPNSKKPRVEKDLSRLRQGFGGQVGRLHVYVKEPPLDGRANEAVIAALASHFKIKKYQVKLIRGRKSKIKTFDLGLQK